MSHITWDDPGQAWLEHLNLIYVFQMVNLTKVIHSEGSYTLVSTEEELSLIVYLYTSPWFQ